MKFFRPSPQVPKYKILQGKSLAWRCVGRPPPVGPVARRVSNTSVRCHRAEPFPGEGSEIWPLPPPCNWYGRWSESLVCLSNILSIVVFFFSLLHVFKKTAVFFLFLSPFFYSFILSSLSLSLSLFYLLHFYRGVLKITIHIKLPVRKHVSITDYQCFTKRK